jgi:hypothetical protein
MLGTSSFHILQELKKKKKKKKRNKTKQLWVLSSMISLSTQGASCLCTSSSWIPLSVVEILPTHLCVVATHCLIKSVFINSLWSQDSE